MPASVAGSDDGDCDSFIVDVDMLSNHGTQALRQRSLKTAAHYSHQAVHGAMMKQLLKIKGFSEIKAEKVKEAARKCLPNSGGFTTGAELLQVRKRCFRLSTGSKQWDAILLGGFQSSSVTEVFGEYRCGKTQLAHTLAVVAQLPKDQGGAEGKVAWIDTEGTFRPERIVQIAERFGIDPETANENIIQARAANSDDQMEMLCRLTEHFATGEFRLLVVDSLMALFRTDYIGRGELSERQQKIGQFLNKLTKTAEEFNLTVFMTNQVQSDPGASALFAGADGRKPVGGHVVAHASTTRILLRKGRGEERVAKIQDSPDCPEREAIYIITTGGINDPEKV